MVDLDALLAERTWLLGVLAEGIELDGLETRITDRLREIGAELTALGIDVD